MTEIVFKKRYYPLVLTIFAVGFLGVNVLNVYFDWLSMLVAGTISLLVLYGWQNLKLFFHPVPSPKFRTLLKYTFAMFILEFVILLFLALFFQHSFSSLQGTALNYGPGVRPSLPIRIWVTFTIVVSIVGEEVGMASISIPLVHILLQTKIKKLAWPLVNVLGCILFASLHLPHYHFHWAFPILVGITRYPITLSWKSTDTLRTGIYLHWISDAVAIISLLL